MTALRISPVTLGGSSSGGRRRQSCVTAYPGCLYTASCDGRICVWLIDAARGWKLPDTSACALSLSGHSKPVRALGFFRGADGALVSGSDDMSLIAWDPQGGEAYSGAQGADEEDSASASDDDGAAEPGTAGRGARVEWSPRGMVGHTGGVRCLAMADDLLFRCEFAR